MKSGQRVLRAVLDEMSVLITSSETVQAGYRVHRTMRPDLPCFLPRAESVSLPGGVLRHLPDRRPLPSFEAPPFPKELPSSQSDSLPPLLRERGGVLPALRPCRDTRCPLRLRHGSRHLHRS